MFTYYQWDTVSDVPLSLQLVNLDGTGLTGSHPTVSIKRIQQVSGGPADGYYWNSASFIATPTSLSMSEVDPVNFPGVYKYIFSQSLIQQETMYMVYYASTYPLGYEAEIHTFENKLSGSIKIYEAEAF